MERMVILLAAFITAGLWYSMFFAVFTGILITLYSRYAGKAGEIGKRKDHARWDILITPVSVLVGKIFTFAVFRAMLVGVVVMVLESVLHLSTWNAPLALIAYTTLYLLAVLRVWNRPRFYRDSPFVVLIIVCCVFGRLLYPGWNSEKLILATYALTYLYFVIIGDPFVDRPGAPQKVRLRP